MEHPTVFAVNLSVQECPASDKVNTVSWITLRTTSFRWEAELIQQLLAAHNIPVRIVDLGSVSYMGWGSAAAVQVQPQDATTAWLLVSPLEEEVRESENPE